MIYYSIFVTFFLIKCIPRNSQLQWLLGLTLFCGLFVFVALRFKVGCDWTGYEAQLKLQENFQFGFGPFEPGWNLILGSVVFVSGDITLLNVISAVIFFGGCLHLSGTFNRNLIFFFFIFPVLVVGLAMSGIRQATSIGFFMSSIAFATQGKKYFSYSLVMLAISVHASAISMLPIVIYVNRGFEISLKSFLTFVGLLLGAIVFLFPYLGIVTAGLNRYSTGEITSSGATFRILFLLASSLSLFFVLHANNTPLVFLRLLRASFLYSLVLLVSAQISSVVADRLSYFLIPLLAKLTSRILLTNSINRDLVFWFNVTLICLFFLVWLNTSFYFDKCYSPYRTSIL